MELLEDNVSYSLGERDGVLNAEFFTNQTGYVLQLPFESFKETRESIGNGIVEHVYRVSSGDYIKISGVYFISCVLNRYSARDRWYNLVDLGFEAP